MLRNETCKRSVSFWVKRVNKSHIPFRIPSALDHIAWENGRHFAMQPQFCPRHRNFFALFSDVMSRETIDGITKMSAVFLGFTSQCKRNNCLTIDQNSIKRLSYYTFQQSHFCCYNPGQNYLRIFTPPCTLCNALTLFQKQLICGTKFPFPQVNVVSYKCLRIRVPLEHTTTLLPRGGGKGGSGIGRMLGKIV